MQTGVKKSAMACFSQTWLNVKGYILFVGLNWKGMATVWVCVSFYLSYSSQFSLACITDLKYTAYGVLWIILAGGSLCNVVWWLWIHFEYICTFCCFDLSWKAFAHYRFFIFSFLKPFWFTLPDCFCFLLVNSLFMHKSDLGYAPAQNLVWMSLFPL